MVRKVSALFFCVALFFAFGITAHAQTYTPYEGTMSSSYVSYFKDILSGVGFDKNYVALRSGQYEYVMVVGDLEYDGNSFTSNGTATVYTITNSGNYNSSYSYNVSEISSLSITPDDKIIYSDLGQFPQLMERGAKYEMLSAVLMLICLLGVVIGRIFDPR